LYELGLGLSLRAARLHSHHTLTHKSTANCPVQSSLHPSPVVFDKFDICSTDEVSKTICSAESKDMWTGPAAHRRAEKISARAATFCYQHVHCIIAARLFTTVSAPCGAVTPRMKKHSMDTKDVKSFCPISNPTFMSKTVERLVCRQLVSFRLRSPFQKLSQTCCWRATEDK